LTTCSDVQLVPPVVFSPPDSLTVDATVEFLNIESGCWALTVSSALRFEPANLPTEFRVDGLKVQATVRHSPTASTCMIGPVVELIAIQRR
jgi:hypothetical protein